MPMIAGGRRHAKFLARQIPYSPPSGDVAPAAAINAFLSTPERSFRIKP
jgi:hypothetical protein